MISQEIPVWFDIQRSITTICYQGINLTLTDVLECQLLRPTA